MHSASQSKTSDDSLRILHLPPRRPDPRHAPLLVPPKPRLERITENPLADEIDDQSYDNAHKGNGIQEVDCQAKHLDADDDAPEVRGEQTDVEEGSTAHAEDNRAEGIKEGQSERVSRQVPTNLRVPVCGLERATVEDSRLDAVDDHTPEAELADNLVQRSLADEEFFGNVGEAVKGCAEEGEEVALQRIIRRPKVIGSGDVIRCEQNAKTTDADEDASNLGRVVANAEEEK